MRGGESLAVTVDDSIPSPVKTWDFELLDRTLARLEEKNPRLSRVVESRGVDD